MVRSSLNIPKREKGGSVSPAGSSVFDRRALVVWPCIFARQVVLEAKKKNAIVQLRAWLLSPSMIPARFFRVSFVE